jgi:hypothetical protein
VADTRRGFTRARGGLLALLAVSALIVALLAGCGETSTEDDPFAGYWIGAGEGQMTLVQIAVDGGEYTILANPDVPVGDAEEKDGDLVVDTHAVLMTFTPAAADELTLAFSGEMFEQPRTVSLKRADKTQYADAATGLGVSAIKRGLAMWEAGGGKKYPPPSEVTPAGLLGKMIRWPNNLFTGTPMAPGESEGDYTYTRLDGGKDYSLVGHLSGGGTVGQ